MTTEHEASRTLVKSPPELWAECSDAGSLARHLGEFGEITITRLEPETTVAWEGEHASGTVRIEPSGWGTRVTLTARARALEADSGAREHPAAEEPSAQEPVGPGNPARAQPAIEPTAQEEDDATLEEATEEPDLPVASDAGAFRIRWQRMTASMRNLFRSAEPVAEEKGQAPAEEKSQEAAHEEGQEPAAQEPAGNSIPQPPSAAAEPPEAIAQPERAEADAVPEPSVDAESILTAALESLGQAHHRPFSRS